jgi:hypothetical protein
MLIFTIVLAAWLIAPSAMAQSPNDAASSGSSRPPDIVTSDGATLAALAPLAQATMEKDEKQQRVLILLLMDSGSRIRALGTIGTEGIPRDSSEVARTSPVKSRLRAPTIGPIYRSRDAARISTSGKSSSRASNACGGEPHRRRSEQEGRSRL